jgi:hypothetical protein
MDTPLAFQPYSALLDARSKAAAESSQRDLIFVQNFGLVPKHIVTASRPATRPAAERKWLGTDFSHVIVSQ